MWSRVQGPYQYIIFWCYSHSIHTYIYSRSQYLIYENLILITRMKRSTDRFHVTTSLRNPLLALSNVPTDFSYYTNAFQSIMLMTPGEAKVSFCNDM